MNKGFEFINENGRRIVKGHGHYEATYVSNCRELVKRSKEKYGLKVAFKFKRNGKLVEKTYI